MALTPGISPRVLGYMGSSAQFAASLAQRPRVDRHMCECRIQNINNNNNKWLPLRMKQNVGIPVLGRGEGISGLQGFLPGQSSTSPSRRSLTFPVEVFKVLILDRVR